MRPTNKRILAVLLVLLQMLTLLPAIAPLTAAAKAPAAADGERTQNSSDCVFITQPAQTVQIAPETLTYMVTWGTNFMPTQVDIMRRAENPLLADERVGSPLYLNGAGSYEFPATASVATPYYIRACYSDAETGETRSVDSNDFLLDRSSLVFSLPPTAAPELDPNDLTWTVRWATNFTPVRVEAVTNIMGLENYETANTPYATMTEGLSTTPSMVFDYSTPRTEYYLRAYYTDDLYVVSMPFTIADPEPVFVTQPPPTVGLDADLNFTVFWRTNFIPTHVSLVRDGNELSGVVRTDDLSNEMSWSLPHTLSTDGVYQIRAKNGLKSVDSAPFQLSDANMFFSEQPDETISIRLSDLQYVIHWRTTFNPVKIEVMYRDGGTGINSDTVIATVTENLQQEMYHVLFADSLNACAYYIRAYYAEDKFVTSSVFRLSRDNLAFGNQPYDVVIDPDAFAGATSWTLNFLPVKVEVWQDTSPSSWGDLQDRLIDTIHPTDSGQFLYTFFAESGDDHPYYLRAYFADQERCYVRSENFRLDYSQFRFTKQPVLLDHQDGQNTYTIFWETSYVPERVVIRCDDEEFTYLGRDSIVAELTEDLTKAGSHTFTWEAGKEHDFYVSAYYGSNRTAETATAVEAAFTVQPQSGNVSQDVPYAVSWELSGSPTRVELYAMYLDEDVYVPVLISSATGPDATSIPVDYRTAERYWGELYYLRAWYGEGENDSIESIRFMIRPSLRLNQVFLDTLGSSYAFTEADRFQDSDDFEAWANNAAGTNDFAYRVRYPQDAALCEINLMLWDDSSNEVLSVRYYNGSIQSEGLPADILKPSPAGGAVEIDTTIPELRERFHDYAVSHRLLNPDIFTVYMTVSVRTEWSGWENYSFKLFDTHMPQEPYWPDIDFETFTLTTPLTPELEFCDAAPAITSVQSQYYTVFATELFDCDENPFPADVGDLSWRGYFSPDVYDEELDEWVTVPTAERFEQYFGNGYNAYVEGPANPAPSGPDHFLCGIAANKLTRSGASLDAASMCLADLIRSENQTYINSLPGLSRDAWFGYYPPETEFPNDYEPVWYELLASVEDELTVTFADGVVYRASLPMIMGMESSFQVVGDPYEPPEEETFPVTWLDEDGETVLAEAEITSGEIPVYPNEPPVKASDAEKDYAFLGWMDDDGELYEAGEALPAATGAAVYTAVFEESPRAYTVTWVVDGEETQQTVHYYEVPGRADPVKPASGSTIYTFLGWRSGEGVLYRAGEALPAVTGDVTYTAEFTENQMIEVSFFADDVLGKNGGEPIALTGGQTDSSGVTQQPNYPSYMGWLLTGVTVVSGGETTEVALQNGLISNAAINAAIRSNEAAVTAHYVKDTSRTYRVEVKYELADGTALSSYTTDEYTVGDAMQITAPETKTYGGETYYFNCWLVGEASYQMRTITLRPNEARQYTVTAVYDAEPPASVQATAAIQNAFAETQNGKNKVAVTMTWSAPEAETIVKAGFLVATKDPTDPSVSVTPTEMNSALKTNTGTYTLHMNMTGKEDRAVYVRAVLVYVDENGAEQTVMSEWAAYTWNGLSQASAEQLTLAVKNAIRSIPAIRKHAAETMTAP